MEGPGQRCQVRNPTWAQICVCVCVYIDFDTFGRDISMFLHLCLGVGVYHSLVRGSGLESGERSQVRNPSWSDFLLLILCTFTMNSFGDDVSMSIRLP